MGTTDSKLVLPALYHGLTPREQADAQRRFQALVADEGAEPEAAVLEILAQYQAARNPAAFLAAADANHDGVVTVAEVAAAMVAGGASATAAHAAASAMVSAADVNRDGVAALEELQKFAIEADVREAVGAGAVVVDVRGVEEGLAKPAELVPLSLKLPFVLADGGASFVAAVRGGALLLGDGGEDGQAGHTTASTDRRRKIIVHCASGRRAAMAIEKLWALGYRSGVLNGITGAAINTALAKFASGPQIRAAVNAATSTAAAANDDGGNGGGFSGSGGSGGGIVLDVRGEDEVARAGDKVDGSIVLPFDATGEAFAAAVRGGALLPRRQSSLPSSGDKHDEASDNEEEQEDGSNTEEEKRRQRLLPVAVHCRSGTRAQSAVEVLHRLGYRNAFNAGSAGVVRQALQERPGRDEDERRLAEMIAAAAAAAAGAATH
jgi:rhodanese-related sulfurtransferase